MVARVPTEIFLGDNYIKTRERGTSYNVDETISNDRLFGMMTARI
jgi:hypothetical protein